MCFFCNRIIGTYGQIILLIDHDALSGERLFAGHVNKCSSAGRYSRFGMEIGVCESVYNIGNNDNRAFRKI